MSVFQERLRHCRKSVGLNQQEMAAELGIVFRSYRRYECGDSEPTLSTLVKPNRFIIHLSSCLFFLKAALTGAPLAFFSPVSKSIKYVKAFCLTVIRLSRYSC